MTGNQGGLMYGFRLGNVRDDFDVLVKGLAVVKRKGKEDWEIYDIIQRLSTDPNCFFLVNNNDFVVLIKQDEQLWGWAFYSECGDAYGKYFDDFLSMGRMMGCTSVGFASSRPAYQKLIKKLGGKIKQIEYQVDI